MCGLQRFMPVRTGRVLRPFAQVLEFLFPVSCEVNAAT